MILSSSLRLLRKKQQALRFVSSYGRRPAAAAVGNHHYHQFLAARTRSRRSTTAAAGQQQQTRSMFQFGSPGYAAAFDNLPLADEAALRQATLDYLDKFDAQAWYDDPIVSLVNGEKLLVSGADTTVVDTVDALGKVNGKQIMATSEQLKTIQEHILSIKPPKTDLRAELRAIEAKLLDAASADGYAGFLIGNQCIDFQKQDGVTELVESVMANSVERNLNDKLLEAEQAGTLALLRRPIFVSCVSNFTNFLDLFRKTLRSIEVGIPCVVLSRSNTSQHAYRWAQLLVELLPSDLKGMVTFISADLADIIKLTKACDEAHATGHLYTTCSRELALQIKSTYPPTIASTGGPNTMVVFGNNNDLPESVSEAIKMSASIECAGQCTALRHVVVPANTFTNSTLENVLSTVQGTDTAQAALAAGDFDKVFVKHSATPEPTPFEYTHHSSAADAFYTIRDVGELPDTNIKEYWRKVVVDFSRLDLTKDVDKLADWLNTTQPISLAVNAPTKKEALKHGIDLWSKTAMVVNTIGTFDSPALTCQARPQEAEVFGEFPPRASLRDYTQYPVFIPSSNAALEASYTRNYLEQQAGVNDAWKCQGTKLLVDAIDSDIVLGYCRLLIDFLKEASGPKQGFATSPTSRTAVWGWQRPPLQTTTVLRIDPKGIDKKFMDAVGNNLWNVLAPIYLLFYTTNARKQVQLSVEPSPQTKELIRLLQANHIHFEAESEATMQDRIEKDSKVWNTVHVLQQKQLRRMIMERKSVPMVDHFCSLYLPLGHIKSTEPNDTEFVEAVMGSEKWLQSVV